MITRKDLVDAVKDNAKIFLIKSLREVSGLGLKDSKEAIDAIFERFSSMVEMEAGILNLFGEYMPDLFLNPTPVPIHPTIEERIRKGVDCAIANYRTLGFANVFDAIRTVLSNLESQD